jgi:phenazine biosynthesis protein phzE
VHLTPAQPTAPELVARLLAPGCPPFALLHRRTPGRPEDAVEILLGPVEEAGTLTGIPLPTGAPGSGAPVTDALALVPFRQIRERGFDVRDDGTPLAVLRPRESYELPLAELLAALPDREVRVEGGTFDVDDEAYAEIVERVVRDEIGRGEGANFVIRRTFRGSVPDYGPDAALALFGRLLRGERGAYWTYAVHTPDRTLVGASPEVHVRMSGGTVVMNPISGTYRYPEQGPSAEGLLAFLHDPKEVEELTMVVDEELKMMSAVCGLGGVVVGPRLKEMAHLAHTEYELRGRSAMDVREVLRETMFAATVTGSPVQNACRVIERHEPGGRGYYAGALALIGRDAGGAQTLDSPILIRTADISPAGELKVPVGATLVRRSEPRAEVAETHAKAAGVLTALGVRPAPVRDAGAPRPPLADDIRVRAALDARRADLAPFWLRMQTGPAAGDPADGFTSGGPLSGHAFVVDGEDTFTAMLRTQLQALGLSVDVRRFDERPDLGRADLLVMGPGPGDPRALSDSKIAAMGAMVDRALDDRRPLLAICLSHQLLALRLGFDLRRLERPNQGVQRKIDLFGAGERVAFYNTYAAFVTGVEAGVEVSRDTRTGEVHALRGPNLAGLQFHPESIMTVDGTRLLGDAVRAALA